MIAISMHRKGPIRTPKSGRTVRYLLIVLENDGEKNFFSPSFDVLRRRERFEKFHLVAMFRIAFNYLPLFSLKIMIAIRLFDQ